MKIWNYLFATEVAWCPVETPLITERKPALQSALRAPRRRRHFYFFVKLKVLRLNSELNLTILALFILGSHNLIFWLLWRIIALCYSIAASLYYFCIVALFVRLLRQLADSAGKRTPACRLPVGRQGRQELERVNIFLMVREVVVLLAIG